MSQLKTQQPIIHIPSFKTYRISGGKLRSALMELEVDRPMGMLDYWYYYTDLEGWGKILYDLTFKSSLYQVDKRDCEWYAFAAKVKCEERYGLNTMGMVIGNTPLGRHAFNMFFTGTGFLLWEPNDGYPFAGLAFKIGEHNYRPELVLI